MATVLQPGVSGPTKSEVQLQNVKNLGDALQFAGTMRQRRQEQAWKQVTDVWANNPYGMNAFANTQLADSMSGVLGTALGTRDRETIQQFTHGMAMAAMDPDVRAKYLQDLYQTGQLKAETIEELKDPDAWQEKYKGLWKAQEEGKAPETEKIPDTVTVPTATAPTPTPAPGGKTSRILDRAELLAVHKLAGGTGDTWETTNSEIKTREGMFIQRLNSQDETVRKDAEAELARAMATLSPEKVKELQTEKQGEPLTSKQAPLPPEAQLPNVTSIDVLESKLPLSMENEWKLIKTNLTSKDPKVKADAERQVSRLAQQYGVTYVPQSGNMGVGAVAGASGQTPSQTPQTGGTFREWLVAQQNAGADFTKEKSYKPVGITGSMTDEQLQKKNPGLAEKWRGQAQGAVAAPTVAPQAAAPTPSPSPITPEEAARRESYASLSAGEKLIARYLGKDPSLTPQDMARVKGLIQENRDKAIRELRTTFKVSKGAEDRWNPEMLREAAYALQVVQPELGAPEDNPTLAPLFMDTRSLEKRKAEAQIQKDLATAMESAANAGYLDMRSQSYGVELAIEAAKLELQKAQEKSKSFTLSKEIFLEENKPYIASLTSAYEELAKDPGNAKAREKVSTLEKYLEGKESFKALRNNLNILAQSEAGGSLRMVEQSMEKAGWFNRLKKDGVTYPQLLYLLGEEGTPDTAAGPTGTDEQGMVDRTDAYLKSKGY